MGHGIVNLLNVQCPIPNKGPSSNDQSDDWTVYFSCLLVATVLQLFAKPPHFPRYSRLQWLKCAASSKSRSKLSCLYLSIGMCTDWDLDIGVSLDTLKKPKGVFQGGGDLRSKLPQLVIIRQPLDIGI